MREAARRKRILRKQENRLRDAIKRSDRAVAIARLAEAVRAVQLSLIHGQHENIAYEETPSESELRHLANFQRKLAEWQARTTEEIVHQYSNDNLASNTPSDGPNDA